MRYRAGRAADGITRSISATTASTWLQMLLTRDDFNDHHRTLNIKKHDVHTDRRGRRAHHQRKRQQSAWKRSRSGDNDTLAASTAILWNADLLIILSDIDGVFDKDPKASDDAQTHRDRWKAPRSCCHPISIGEKELLWDGWHRNEDRSRPPKVNRFGIPMILLNGAEREHHQRTASTGTAEGTLFLRNDRQIEPVLPERRAGRHRWRRS